MLSKRTNILFDEDMWRELVEEAKARNTSVGDLVREAVEVVYRQDVLQRRTKEAVQQIKKNRPIQSKIKIDYKSLIEEGRR